MARLEKENAELKARDDQRNNAVDFDLKSKCAKDSDAWFQRHWVDNDKDTISVNYINHYNKKLNTCFVRVTFSYRGDDKSTWRNISVWDVYENAKYSDFSENTDYRNQASPRRIYTCESERKDCTTEDQFDGMISSFLND